VPEARRGRAGLRRQLSGRGRRGRDGADGSADSQWFWDHYDVAAGEIVDFCESSGVRLKGTDVADIGCGDGIMALGLCHRARPRRLVAFDVVPTNTEMLLERSRAGGVAASLPAELEFRQSAPSTTPAEDASFDLVYSWSAFEHIGDPVGVLREIRRIIRPGGVFFLQLWPFYHSAKGSHLWDWFAQDFHHLLAGEREIVEQMRASDRHSDGWTEYMAREFEQLNRVTLDELQRAVLTAGFDVRRLELLSSSVLLTPELARYSWSDLGIGGIKLLASPRL
jgi:ubiquinone/menaquinone biosynthesis C-methylase UbiE